MKRAAREVVITHPDFPPAILPHLAPQILESRLVQPDCRVIPTLSGCFTGGAVINCFFAIITAAFAMAGVAPFLGTAASACAAAGRIFEVIDRVPPIDSLEESGLAPDPSTLRGHIELRGVTFAYPSRPDEPVLRDFSVVIEPGTTVGLCGGSGSGKSTIVALLQRLYDPQAGVVLLDGVDVRRYNVQWLRSVLGLVSQEPTLFACSIGDNIALGRTDGIATPAEVTAACVAANAHGFASRLPQGYDTLVGDRGSQLSGGQKQRVAIARAILRNPRVLLLDEATSALDTQSERLVQAALDRLVSSGGGGGGASARTSLIIAHRLSTIAAADRILVLSRGSLVEDGSHAQLMARPGGVYRGLRELQGLTGLPDAGAAPASTTADPSAPSAEEGAPGGPRGLASAPWRATPHSQPQAPAPSLEEGEEEELVAAPAAASEAPASALVKSAAAKARAAAEEEEEDADLPPVPTARAWALNRPEAHFIFIALIAAAANGAVQPLFR